MTRVDVEYAARSLYRGYNYSGSSLAYKRFHRVFSVKTTAILRDCKEVVARENGFSSWALLLGDIERVAR